MAHALTVAQLAAISTRKPPPWNLADLRKIYNIQGSLSLRSLINKVQEGNAVFYLQFRDFSLLNSVRDLDDLRAKWNSSIPSKATLVQISAILSTVGASIVFADMRVGTIAVAGTFGSLAGLQVFRVDSQTIDGVAHIAEGGIAVGTSGLGLVTLAGGVSAGEGATLLLVAGVGFSGLILIGGVFLIGLGIYELATAGDISPAPAPDADAGVPTQFGPVPKGVDPEDPPDTPIDINSVPDTPPICPTVPICPVVPPVCPAVPSP